MTNHNGNCGVNFANKSIVISIGYSRLWILVLKRVLQNSVNKKSKNIRRKEKKHIYWLPLDGIQTMFLAFTL